MDFNEGAVCSFGSRTSPAVIVSSGEIHCISPESDVVARAMPFGISLNG
jgi:hypothetical protein